MTDINLTPTGSYIEFTPDGEPPNGGYIKADGVRAYDTVPITARTWGNPAECRSGALLVHGLGAHSGWFEALARRLKVRQFYVMAYDQIGFGRRRHQSFATRRQWIDDLRASYHKMQTVIGDKPIYVMGNSMGALVALKAAPTLNKVHGLVMFSPGFEGCPTTFRLPYRLHAIWTALTQPEKEVQLPYGIDTVTRDNSVRQWLEHDTERRFALPARMMLELLKLSQEIQMGQKVATCPVLMMTAGIENIVDNNVAEQVFDKLLSPNKRKIAYPEAWHDLMFDPVIDQVTDDVVQWTADIAPERIASGK